MYYYARAVVFKGNMYKLLLFSLIAVISCGVGSKPVPVVNALHTTADSLNPAFYGIVIQPHDTNYIATCMAVKRQRIALQQKLAAGSVSIDSVQRYFTSAIVNTLIPHWYGTVWSFEGHTSIPKQGEIACGYFVSTVLTQAGLNVNRYKVAQQLPYYEALTYACGDSVYTLNGATQTIERLRTDEFKEGLYFLGMARSHVGLLLKQQGEILFFHANYVDGKVVVELARNSGVFNTYHTFYITPLSTNKGFLTKWLGAEALTVQAGS